MRPLMIRRAVGMLAPVAGAMIATGPRVCRTEAAGGHKWGVWNFFDRPASSSAQDALSKVPPIKIYQYEICPFCNKIKAVLDFYRVPYTTVEVNPLTKKEFQVTKNLPAEHPAHNYRRVPIAQVGDDIIGDSPLILDRVVADLISAGVINGAAAKQCSDPKVLEWVKWSDSKLAILLFPNLTRSFKDSYEAFSYIWDAPNFSFADKVSNRMAGSLAMWLAQGKIKKKYNIEDERKALFDCIDQWISALEGRPFNGGQEPNLADLCVFGTLRAVEGSETQKVLLKDTKLGPWYERMEAKVGPRSVARTKREAE